MLKLPTNKIKLKINDNPIDLIPDGVEIEDCDCQNILINWSGSILKVPISGYSVTVVDDLVCVHIDCTGIMERKVFGFIC